MRAGEMRGTLGSLLFAYVLVFVVLQNLSPKYNHDMCNNIVIQNNIYIYNIFIESCLFTVFNTN